MDFIRFIFSGFWHFVGFAIILGLLIDGSVKLIRGYPPAHCDADGDLKEEDNK